MRKRSNFCKHGHIKSSFFGGVKKDANQDAFARIRHRLCPFVEARQGLIWTAAKGKRQKVQKQYTHSSREMKKRALI